MTYFLFEFVGCEQCFGSGRWRSQWSRSRSSSDFPALIVFIKIHIIKKRDNLLIKTGVQWHTFSLNSLAVSSVLVVVVEGASGAGAGARFVPRRLLVLAGALGFSLTEEVVFVAGVVVVVVGVVMLYLEAISGSYWCLANHKPKKRAYSGREHSSRIRSFREGLRSKDWIHVITGSPSYHMRLSVDCLYTCW